MPSLAFGVAMGLLLALLLDGVREGAYRRSLRIPRPGKYGLGSVRATLNLSVDALLASEDREAPRRFVDGWAAYIDGLERRLLDGRAGGRALNGRDPTRKGAPHA